MDADTRRRWKDSIMRHEGLVLAVYDDATGRTVGKGDTLLGWPTIGYGRNLTGRGITKPEADYLLHNDMAAVEAELDALIPWWKSLDQVRQLVVAEMCFQMGSHNVVRGWPKTIDDIRSGRYAQAAVRMRQSKWATQTKARAYYLAGLMERGAWS